MDEFYYDKHPNLIGPIMKTTVCTIVKKQQINNTVSDKISSYVTSLYNDYIADNKIIIFIIVAFVVYLIYKYYNKTPTKNDKANKEENKEKFTNQEYNLLKEIEDYQTQHLMYDNPPSMNPLTSNPELQQDDIFYPPDPLPVNLPGSGIVYKRNIYERDLPNYKPLNFVNYDHNNVYTNPSRSYSSGTYNTYNGAQDTNITNPYNWSNNFNTNTGNFVGPMTNMNRDVLNQYQSRSDNTSQNLLDALKFGPRYDTGEIDPPYAADF